MASSTQLFEGANHFISLEKAKAMTALYRAEKVNILEPQYKQQDILLDCETFNRSAFDTLLGEWDCVGIRLYFGMTDALTVKIIAVGVNSEGKDILPLASETSQVDAGGAFIVEEGVPCPPICPNPPNLL